MGGSGIQESRHGQKRLIVVSVPHTGTNLVCGFLDFIGVSYVMDHLLNIDTYADNDLVMPVRDPALQFLSSRKRELVLPFNDLLDNCVKFWDRQKTVMSNFNPFLIPTDMGEERGAIALSALAEKLNIDAGYYGWPVVGNCMRQPTTMQEYASVSDGERGIIFSRLHAHRERLGYI